MGEKYIVKIFTDQGEIEVPVEGKPNIDSDGYLRFGRDNYVFNHGSWSWFKKDK